MSGERHDYVPGDAAADGARPCSVCGERRPAAVHRAERRRAVVRLDEQAIAHMLALPEGLRVIGVHADFHNISIMVMVEGDALAPVTEATVPPTLVGEWQPIEPTDDDAPVRVRWVPPNYQTG